MSMNAYYVCLSLCTCISVCTFAMYCCCALCSSVCYCCAHVVWQLVHVFQGCGQECMCAPFPSIMPPVCVCVGRAAGVGGYFTCVYLYVRVCVVLRTWRACVCFVSDSTHIILALFDVQRYVWLFFAYPCVRVCVCVYICARVCVLSMQHFYA
eukprot:GDKI01048816.1.p2 GENE.GDKI01048816.1~~GDKI01048816.1.p2  ORF type:complete len:153 (+),score=19.14 GDKI01048816.1:372-830(+)